MAVSAVADDIRAIFADAGCRGWLRAEVVGVPSAVVEVGSGPVVAASVYKIVVMIAAARAFDRHVLVPTDPVRISPADCTPGPTGFSTFSDPVTVSWRDLVRSMITVSDNAAADVLLAAVGMAAVEEVIADLGLTGTRIIGGTAAVAAQVVHDTGDLTSDEVVGLLASNYTITDSAAFDPAYTTCTTGRDTNRMLADIWTGRAASPTSCEFMKAVLAQQIWPHRIRSAFPFPDVVVAGKTGTIGPIRNEVAVVAFRGERPVAVSVFTRAARSDAFLPVVDAAIGRAARVAVTELRTGS